MAKGDIHTVHRDGKWFDEVEGGDRASNSAAMKADAQATGRDMARERKVEHVIHNLDGTMRAQLLRQRPHALTGLGLDRLG
jgi:hypothetical protein